MSCLRTCFDKDSKNFGYEDCQTCKDNDDGRNHKLDDQTAKSSVDCKVMRKIYGVVEWINENPMLDGMQGFKDKESAYKYCEGRLSGQVDKNIFVKHTIIEINFST